MDDGEHVNTIASDRVDDSVRTFEYLADRIDVKLGDDAPGMGKSANLLRATRQAVDGAAGIFRRSLRDVIVDGPQMAERLIRLVDFHCGSPKSFRTCSTLVTRRASLSARPISMACRT